MTKSTEKPLFIKKIYFSNYPHECLLVKEDRVASTREIG
jgi:hypothetical protein